MEIEGRRIAWDEYIRGQRAGWDGSADWIVVAHDQHITVRFWNKYISGEHFDAHIYVVEEGGMPVRVMRIEERRHHKWNDEASPQLWRREKGEDGGDSTDISTADDFTSVASVTTTATADRWKLALAAHFSDVDGASDLGETSVSHRITQFLQQQRALRADDEYEPEHDDPIQEFLWFLEKQKKTSKTSTS